MAFADDIALYALGYWSHEQHPYRINSICLNTKQRKTPCRACSDACPQGIVLHSGKANWTGCTNCNLCVTACPTAAINQSSTSFEAIRKLILEGNAPISFACERVEESCDVRCVCLATIPWDLAAAAALENGVVIKADACKTCPHTEYVNRVKELVHTLKHFLGKEFFAQSVFLHDKPGKTRSAGTDRRLALTRVKENIASASEKALGENTTPTMSCYRAFLLEVISHLNKEKSCPEVSWYTLVEDGNCSACEICTKMCPHNALELSITGYTDLEDAEDAAETPLIGIPSENSVESTGPQEAQASEQFLFHEASKCTQCGLCYVSCPNENLGGWNTLHTKILPALSAYPLHVLLCEKCGRPFKPESTEETLCKVCNRQTFRITG